MTSESTSAGAAPKPLFRTLWAATGALRGSVIAGAVAGAIAAGLGSRVAMRLIFLADPDTEGAFTDAQATVGDITLEGTLGLLALGTIAGVMGGLVYLGLRRWLPVPAAWKGLAYGVLTLLTVGQLLFDTNNADFQIFEPVLLVLALFSVLFLINGLILNRLLDRFHPEPAYAASLRVSRTITGVIAAICLLGIIAHTVKTIEIIDDEGTCLTAVGGGNGCAVRPPGVAP